MQKHPFLSRKFLVTLLTIAIAAIVQIPAVAAVVAAAGFVYVGAEAIVDVKRADSRSIEAVAVDITNKVLELLSARR